jgi:hypothetical protein
MLVSRSDHGVLKSRPIEIVSIDSDEIFIFSQHYLQS